MGKKKEESGENEIKGMPLIFPFLIKLV